VAIAVVEWVFKHSRSKNGARLVMLAIADACNRADGTGAYPSIPELMSKTNLSERAVQDGTKALVTLGELKVEVQAGPGGHNRYCVLMNVCEESAPPQILHPADSAPPADSSETPADSAAGGADSAPGTNNEPKENHSPPTGESAHAHADTGDRGSKSSQTKRGTRLPADFARSVITADLVAWVRKECPDVDGKDQTNRFVDYWSEKTGKDATKLDWVGTWRNWMRREQDKYRRPANGRASPNGSNFANGSGARARTWTAEEIDAMDLEGKV
jgi:hypothetical protein